MGADPFTIALIVGASVAGGMAAGGAFSKKPSAPKPAKLLPPPEPIEDIDKGQKDKLGRLQGRRSTIVNQGLLSEPPVKSYNLIPL
jgi:hypothetical protein